MGADRGRPLRILVCARQLPNHSEAFRVARLLDRGDCELTLSEDGATDCAGHDAVLLLGNAVWFPAMVTQLRRSGAGRRPVVAIWHWEPLPPPRASGLSAPSLSLRELAKLVLRDRRANDVYTNARGLRELTLGGKVDLLFASTPSRVEYLAEQGIRAQYVPLGYETEYGHDRGEDRDLDVLFLGELRVRRRRRVLRRLRDQGVAVEARGDWFDPQFWGESRSRLLNRAKIFLNVLRFPGEFSGLRMILGMANGALVLSEPMYRHEPFVAGEHFVSATAEEMPDAIRHYLQRDDERQRIARAGRDLVTTELKLERSVDRIFEAVRQRVAA